VAPTTWTPNREGIGTGRGKGKTVRWVGDPGVRTVAPPINQADRVGDPGVRTVAPPINQADRVGDPGVRTVALPINQGEWVGDPGVRTVAPPINQGYGCGVPGVRTVAPPIIQGDWVGDPGVRTVAPPINQGWGRGTQRRAQGARPPSGLGSGAAGDQSQGGPGNLIIGEPGNLEDCEPGRGETGGARGREDSNSGGYTTSAEDSDSDPDEGLDTLWLSAAQEEYLPIEPGEEEGTEEGGCPPGPPDPESGLTGEQERRVGDIMATIHTFFPDDVSPDSEAHVRSVALRAFKRADLDYGIDEAVRAAGDFSISEATCTQDCAEFDALGGNLEALVERRKAKLAEGRLSPARVVAALSSANPYYERVLLIARDGIVVSDLLPPEFEPSGPHRDRWPLQRSKFIKAAPAVEQLIQKNFLDKKLALVLDSGRAQSISGLSVHPSGWAPKAGKVQGRNTGDPTTMNTLFTKQAADQRFGVIHHPTIDDFIRMVLDFVERTGGDWGDVVIWKMDIKGAYTLLSIATADVCKFATEVTREKVVLYLCGFFGWTGTPAHFHPITMALQWELRRLLRGDAGVYVDDIVGVCRRGDLESELATGKRLVESLLGPGTIEDSKTKAGRRVEVIGFNLDLDKQLLAISDRCVERALGGYMSVRVQAPVPVRTVMRLASWAVRYTKVCRFMAPFVRALYASIKGRHLHTSIVLSSAAAISVGVVQALLALTVVKERAFTRNFEAWRARAAGWAIVGQFDASLGGIGVIWYLRSPDGAESLIGGASLDIRHLGFGEDSRFQNVAEFLAIICAVRGLQKLRDGGQTINGRAPDRLILRGDSMSALSWAENSRFRSDIATNAAIVFIMLGISAEIHIQEMVHVPAKENGRADYLSRLHEDGRSMGGFGQEYPDLVGMAIVDMGADELIRLSRPDECVGGVQDFMGLWAGIRTALVA
jgi:hypothetical protein